MNDLAIEVAEVMRDAVEGLQIDPSADGERSFADLGIDSLDKMSLLLSVQEKWNVEFAKGEIAQLQSLNDICRRLGEAKA